MDQNVSASPGDADNLVRKKPNAPTDATAPGGIDAAVANAKASAQVAGRTEFMASKLSTVRDASRSEDPTPVSLPKLQPIVGVNTGVVAASDLPTPATTVQGPSPVDLTVTPPGLERAGGTGDPPPVIAKVAWHDVAPPSGSETTVMVPPSNGSVAVEGTGAGSSSTKKSADGKNVLVAIAENLTAGINPSPPPAVRVDLRDAGAPPAGQLLTTSTDLSKHRADLTATLSDQKPLVAAVEPTALTTVTSTNVVFSQPTLNAVTENLGSEILTTGVDGSADQAPLKLNISFQPTNSSEINAPAATKIPLGPPVAAQPEVVAKTQTAATASLSDRSGHVIGNNALSLGNLRETNLTLSQSGLPALTGASVPDAAITQYQPPPLQPALIADLSRLNSSFQNGSDGSLTKNIMLTGATGNPTQSLLVAAISPYNVSFSPTDVTTLANIKPANLPAGTEQLGQKPPLRLALANSVALGATDYSVGTLPTVTTVSLRPSELNTSTAPLVLQANLTSPSTDFRPTKQELSTTPIVLSTSLVPQDNSLATLNEAPPVLKSLEPTQVTSQPGRSVVQRSNLGVGELRQPDAEIVTATPVTLTADLLRTTGDATQDRRVALSSNIASEANGNALITAMNFPLNFPSVEATATAPMTLANSVQSQPFFPTNDNARAVLTSQPLSSGEAIVLNSSSTTKPSIFDQSRDMIALGTTINSIPSDPGDFSLFLPPTKGATIDSTLLTEAGNSNALYRPPTAVSGATFQTGSTEFPLSVPLSTQTGLSGSAARLAELNIASPDNSQLMTKISLGLLNQPDASAIKSNNSGAGIVLASATTNDTTLPSRAPDISNAPNILSDANRTTSNYIAPNRSFEPVQPASTSNALVVEPTNFALQRQIATPLTFDNSGSRGEIADALIAPPTPFSPITKATAYQVADGSAATFTPSNSYAEAPPPSTVATVFPGNTAVFHVNDSALTTIATGSSTLATAYLPQGSDAGISTGVVATSANEATTKITPNSSELSLGLLREPAAFAPQPSGSLVASTSRNDTTLDTNSLTRNVADISNATNLLANGATANYVPSIKPSEPVQLASTTNALVIEPTNFAMQRQVATPLTFDNSGSRGEIADALIAPPTPFSPITKATAYQVADGSAATFTPSNSYAEAPPPSTVATVFPGNTAVFHVNDSALTTIATGSSTLATAYLPQGSDAGISTGVVAFPTNEATPKITPKASQLSLGSLRDSEALPSQASGPVVTAGLRNDTTIDTISSTRTVADISSATNLLANGTTINYVPLAKSFEPVQLASNGGEQSNLSTRGRQPYQPLTYGNTSTLDFSTSVTADGAPYSPQIKNFGAPAVQSTFVTTASSSASSAFDAPPSQAKPPYNVASLNQPLSNDYAVTPLPTNATINFRSGNGDSITPPITVQVADLRSTTTTGGSYASNLNAADFARSAVTTATQEVPSVSGVKLLNSFGQPGEPSSSVGDAQALVAKLGQTAARSSTNQLVAQNSGGYARLSTSALANTTTLSNSDVHALTATTQTPNLTGVLATAPLDGVNKTGTSSLAIAANPLSAGPVIAQEMSKGIALPNVDRLTATTTVDSGILVGSKAVVVADGKGASAPLEQTLHPIVGKAPSLVGDAGLRPVSGNVILLDLTHAPMGPGGLDPSIKVAVTVVKPPETDFTGAKTVINGQILTGRLPDGTALRPDPNGIIFSVKGAGAEVDPAGSKLLTINQKIELIGPATTAGVVGTTTGIISGAVSEINIIGPVPIRGVRIGGDALVDSTLSTINGHPTTGLNASTGKGAPLVAGSNNPDPTSAVGLIATTASGQPVPPNSTAGSPVAPLGSSKPDEDKNQSGVAPGNTGIVVGNTVVPLPNVEFFDGKLNNTRIVAGNRTEEVVNDTLVHGALPPLAGMDQTVSEILAARNGKQDPGIPNFDSNLSPLSTFGDPKRFEPTGGIASNRFGDDIADGKEIKSGHRIDLGAEEGQLVDPKTHINPTKEADPSSVDSLAGKKEAGSKSEIEDGLTARSDANKAEDSELSDDVRNQMTTLLTDQSENLTGVSDRRTVKDFIDELLHHTKRRSYRIESGDTLEKLARRFLKDKRLAHLIYLLNEDLLGNQADFSNIQLRAGQVLIMPSIEDVLQYRIHILHDVMPPHIYKNIMDNPDERIVGSSKLLRATYSCRFGDRLTSVAARHSAIRDEKLWTLIAQLNGLSTATDRNGQPKVALKRAQKLILPSRKDIEDHFRRSSHGMPAKLPVAVPSIPVVDPEIDAFVSPAEERATVNWGDGSDLPTPLSALAQKVEPGTGLSNRELGPDTAPKSGGTNGPNSKGPKSKPRRIEPNEARIVAPEDLGEGSEEICLRLEFQYEGKWLPVIEYTGTKEQIYLHIYTLAGRTDSIPIALPTRSIRELAECDLGANYQRYCQKFLEGDRPI